MQVTIVGGLNRLQCSAATGTVADEQQYIVRLCQRTDLLGEDFVERGIGGYRSNQRRVLPQCDSREPGPLALKTVRQQMREMLAQQTRAAFATTEDLAVVEQRARHCAGCVRNSRAQWLDQLHGGVEMPMKGIDDAIGEFHRASSRKLSQ